MPAGLDGGFAIVKGDVSSQFLSGLLMALPCSRGATTVEVEGTLVSQPYVAMTLAVMEAFGVSIDNRKFRRFDVRPARYVGRDTRSSPTHRPPAISSPWRRSRAARSPSKGWARRASQGDMAFVDVLEHMGCTVVREPDRTTVTGGPLRAVDVDMNAISDTVMTLAVVALFADGVTRIRNVAHIRHKESDRIAALAVELRKLGRRIEEYPDGLVIDPPRSERLQRRGARHLRRPPHGHVVRAGRLADPRRDDPRPGLRRQDLSRVLG